MSAAAFVPHDVDMHPEMSIQIARLRTAELTAGNGHGAPLDAVRRRRLGWSPRRRRDVHLGATDPAPTLVLLPPPRAGRTPGGRDQRVA